MRKPRAYQDQAVAAVRDAFKRGVKGCVIELPTGSGKGYIIANVARQTMDRKGRVLVLVNRDNLVEQLTLSLQEQGMFPVQERGADKASPLSDLVVGSIQTMQGNRLQKWNPDHFKLVISDEVHFSASRTYKETLSHFPPGAFHFGLTATLARHDKKGLWHGFTERAFALSLQDMFREGWLTPFKFLELPVPIKISDKLAGKTRFTEEDEANVFNAGDYLPRLFKEAQVASEGRKSLFFWPNVDSSKAANQYFLSQGIESRHIDGYQTRTAQDDTLRWFAESGISTCHCSDILSYGYDNPSINCIGVMRIGRSIPMLMQRLGRGTRVMADVDSLGTAEERRAAIAASVKPYCLVLDLMLQLGDVECKFATPTDLVTDDEEEREYLRKARVAGAPVSLDDLADKLKTKRATDAQKQLAKLAEDAANAAERKISKHDGPYILHILNREAGPNWKPASEKAINFARSLGYKGPIASGWHASRIIDVYKEHKEKQKAKR